MKTRAARIAFAALFVLSPALRAAAVNIELVLDNARASTALIGATGGTIAATGADGTVFTLSIPANALASEERIIMTPVAQANNVPFSGGLVAGVQLEPTGLRLLQLATLTLAMPRPVPPGLETPMAWHDNGRDLYLHPLVVDPKVIAFKLIHFSGAGIGSGTSTERKSKLASLPCDQESALQQRLVPVLQEERDRERQDLPPDPTFYARVEAILEDYYNFTVRPAMAVALQSKDEDVLFTAVVQAMSTVRTLSYWLAAEDPFLKTAIGQLAQFIAAALTIVSDNAFDRCTKAHKIDEMQTLVYAERVAEAMGAGVDLGTESKVERCGSFELDFDSTINRSLSFSGVSRSDTMHAQAKVPIQYRLSGRSPGEAVASAVLSFTYTASISGPGNCTFSDIHGTDDVFTVYEFELKLNPRKAQDLCAARRRAVHPAAVTDVSSLIEKITIDTGMPTNSITSTCPPTPSFTQTLPEFSALFISLRSPIELPITSLGIPIRDWSEGTGGDLIARKVFQRTITIPYLITETTTLDLFHRPQ